MNAEGWFLLVVVLVAGAVFAWTFLVYEPRMKARAAANKRMFEVVFLRMLLSTARTQAARDEVLAHVLSLRPTMPTWPEWAQVWGDEDPLKTRLLH